VIHLSENGPIKEPKHLAITSGKRKKERKKEEITKRCVVYTDNIIP
jgi:hypothetical protein